MLLGSFAVGVDDDAAVAQVLVEGDFGDVQALRNLVDAELLLPIEGFGNNSGTIFGTLLGYPGPVRASKYRYYDPHFARTQFLALHNSTLQTTGFYYDPVSAQQARVNRTLGTGSTLSYFLAFFPDGGFLYGGTSEYLPDLQRRLQTVDRSLYAGYYRVSRDTAYLEVVDR
nr:hypothetical protein [Tanacetum cinerariifolium]